MRYRRQNEGRHIFEVTYPVGGRFPVETRLGIPRAGPVSAEPRPILREALGNRHGDH